MPSTINVNDVIRITVLFRDQNLDPVDPINVIVNVYDQDEQLLAGYPQSATSTGNTGEFFFDFEAEEVGLFTVEFIGEFSGSPNIIITEEFLVGEAEIEGILAEDQELLFATDVEPLYLDPEEFLIHFPDSGLVEIMELVHKYSSEVDFILNGAEPSFLALDYIRAAVLCALSRIYDYGVGGDEGSITLGDLSITSRASMPRALINRANAVTWCELAAVLRQELIRGQASIRTVVKGSNLKNPIPKRRIKNPYNSRKRDR